MRFIVVVAMYNMAPWIETNIESIRRQNYPDFRCLVGDDLSTDDSLDAARSACAGDDRFQVVAHSRKKYSMGNIHSLIELARPDNEDVIVLVDGDDYLAHDSVLQTVADIYRRHSCWMTYGSYSAPGKPREPVCRPYPQRVVARGRFRSVNWRASHLKTFKYGLWKHIPADAFRVTRAEVRSALRRALLTGRWRTYRYWRDIGASELNDPSGQYAKRCSDRILTTPMLELACCRSRFIPDILYIYRRVERLRPFNVAPERQKWYQRLIRDIVHHKPRLTPLSRL